MKVCGVEVAAEVGCWHHITATISPGRLTALYVNGVRQPLPEDD